MEFERSSKTDEGVYSEPRIRSSEFGPEVEDTKARPSNPISRLINRAEAIDWRYKAQLTVGFCLAIIIPFYLFRDQIVGLGDWGYLGAFIINGLSSATIILPAPGGVVIAIMAQDFNPFLIGIAAGLGGAIGGSTAYFAGAINTGKGRQSRLFRRFERLMRRFGGGIIFTFALIPVLPGDLASLIAGSVRYPLRKYFLYNGVASVIKMTVIAYIGADALARLENIFRDWANSVISRVFS